MLMGVTILGNADGCYYNIYCHSKKYYITMDGNTLYFVLGIGLILEGYFTKFLIISDTKCDRDKSSFSAERRGSIELNWLKIGIR